MRALSFNRDLFVSGFASALLLRLAGAGIAFGLQILLARLLGHAPYGVYILAFTSIATAAIILQLGFGTATLRFVPGYRAGGEWELLRGLLRESGRVVWCASGGVALLVIAVATLLRPGADSTLLWTFCVAAVALPLMTTQHLAEARLRAFDRLVLSRVAPEVLQPLLLGGFVLAVAGARGNVGAVAAMLCAVIATGLTLLFSNVTLRRVAPRAFHGPAREDTRVWRTTAFQLTVFSTTMLVIGQIDVVAAGALLGPEAAASYSTASRISKFVPFGLTAINIALAPMAARLFHAGRIDELQRVTLRAAAAIFVTTVPLAIGAIVYGRSLLGLFGPEFVAGYGALVLLTLGRAVNALCGPTSILLTMSGNQRDATLIAVGSAVLDGSLLLILVPSFGLLGAAAATATTTVAWNLALLFMVRRRMGIRPTLFALLRAGRGRPRPSD